jgi:hypothetical protein
MSARHRHLTATAVLAAAIVPAGVAAARAHHDPHEPLLTGRAVLPVETYADGPPSGAALVTPANHGIVNGIHFPTPSQPVEGFSSIIEGRRQGEFLAMPDNGFGNQANSGDFLIRAYYIRPDFKTADGGSGNVDVDTKAGEFISFRDPNGLMGFPLHRSDGLLTGADIDTESLQRGNDGTLWVGDEFGPWILHFSADGVLLEPPHSLPDNLFSPSNQLHVGETPTLRNSRGFEAMAMSPNGKTLYAILEGSVAGDPAGSRRIYAFDIASGTFTPMADYKADGPFSGVDEHFIADAQAVDQHRLLLIERDGNVRSGAPVRDVYEVDLRRVDGDGFLVKEHVVNLAAIPDPDQVSQPAIHDGDVGLATEQNGFKFTVMCESIEALRILSHHDLLLGCDNNLPNSGRNPALADDNEFITLRIP